MATIHPEDLIYETRNFMLMRAPHPFVSREEGGHLRIFPKNGEHITDRTKLSPQEAMEFMRLSMIAGEALQAAMNELGIPVVKINYEDLGNWAFKEADPHPVLHLHIFGRALNATKQLFPEAVQLPDRSSCFYEGFKKLTDNDTQTIQKHINRLLKQEKYSEANWFPATTH